MRVFPPEQRPIYEPSKRRVTFRNGVLGFLYSAEEPERLRGPQHHHAYCDEIAVYSDPKALFDNLRFGLRLGDTPRIIATTTPRAGHKFLIAMIADPLTSVSRGSTRANRANLPAAVLADFERIYGGTRIGRQELEGELLEEPEGALWHGAQIEALRVRVAPDLVRVVVGVDPSVTSGPNSDEVGIVVAGLGADGHGYVMQDLSGRMSPDDWAQRVVTGFDRHEADKIIGEANNGGDLIESVIRTVRRNVAYEKVHASRGKITRAEPVAALYEQGKVHHVGGFAALETEMTTYVAGESASPNRMDALVWALSFLMLKPARSGRSLSL
jgi:predicted phage terminase large subunit-like protein